MTCTCADTRWTHTIHYTIPTQELIITLFLTRFALPLCDRPYSQWPLMTFVKIIFFRPYHFGTCTVLHVEWHSRPRHRVWDLGPGGDGQELWPILGNNSFIWFHLHTVHTEILESYWIWLIIPVLRWLGLDCSWVLATRLTSFFIHRSVPGIGRMCFPGASRGGFVSDLDMYVRLSKNETYILIISYHHNILSSSPDYHFQGKFTTNHWILGRQILFHKPNVRAPM